MVSQERTFEERVRKRQGLQAEKPHLMIRKDHCVSNDNVFSPTGGKDDDFSDVIRRERLAAPRYCG
jgi:hypothetical protein